MHIHLRGKMGALTSTMSEHWLGLLSRLPIGSLGLVAYSDRARRPARSAGGPWWARSCFRRLGDDVPLGGCGAGSTHCICDGAGSKAFDDQIDAQRELPKSHRECGEPSEGVGLHDEA